MPDMAEETKADLERIRTANLATALYAAEAVKVGLPVMYEAAFASGDPDQMRKAVELMHKIGMSMEPKQAQSTFQVANFQIVLDPNARQERPTRPVELVEEVPPPLPKAEALPAPEDDEVLAASGAEEIPEPAPAGPTNPLAALMGMTDD